MTKEFAVENSLLLERAPVSRNAVVKITQTFRTGTDIDALDYLEMYLRDEQQQHRDLHEINLLVRCNTEARNMRVSP